MDGLFDFLNVGFLHDLLPSSWFDDAHQHFGAGLTDEMIVQSVQEASDFFNMNAPMHIHEDWTTGVMTGMSFTENDDILVFNRQQMLDMGITDKEGFDLVMTHEGAHRKLQGMDTGFTSHQEELCCDYMVGVRAGLNGMAEGKLEASLAGTTESSSHPDGAVRVEAIEAGVAFAHDYMETHNGVPPTFSDCLEHFNQTDVYASTLPQESGHINLRPESEAVDADCEQILDTLNQEVKEYHIAGQFDNDTDEYSEDSHFEDNENSENEHFFVNNRSYHLHEAQVAKENADWHDKRANEAISRGDLSAAKDHAARAASYRRAQQEHINTAKKCTK